MRIGVDTRSLCESKTGIGNYLEQILIVLNKIDKKNEYFLYSPHDFKLHKELEGMNKIIRHSRPGSLWMQYKVPALVAKDRIDLFWGPNYSIPIYNPTGMKTVLTIHDMVSYVYPETLPSKTVFHNRFGLPLYIQSANRIITESISTRRDIENYLGISSSDIDVTLLGVNQLYFRRDFHIANTLDKYNINYPYLLSVGTLEPRKNLISIIEAYKTLINNYTLPHQLIIVGAKGWKYSGLYDLISPDTDLHKRINFLGYVPDEDLPALYQGADIFLYPSFYEGFGLPPLEAMASGTPVVTSNSSSLPEVVGDAALLIDPNSVKQLVQAIERILFNTQLAKSLSQKAFERASTFSWERTAKQTLEVFEKVMNEGSN